MTRFLFEPESEERKPLLSSPAARRGPTLATITALGGVVVGLALVGWMFTKPPRRARRSVEKHGSTVSLVSKPAEDKAALDVTADAPDARVVVDGRAGGTVPCRIDGLIAGTHRVRIEAQERISWESEVHLLPGETQKIAARLSPAPPRLRVESDVPGASVFVDKRFVGKTPLMLRGLSRGRHQLDLSAEGYDVRSSLVALDVGERRVTVRFKELSLEERLDVVHRHAIGRCEGVLFASATELRFESRNVKHSFTAPLGELEKLEVDYLGKNLQVRLRDGRTFNFTVRDKSADPLLVFQQNVNRVRYAIARDGL